jgi:hypothetical protein
LGLQAEIDAIDFFELGIFDDDAGAEASLMVM